VDCDVGHIRAADLATVNALARAYLHALRRGTRLRFTNVSPELRELVAFAGLEEVLLGGDGRKSEEREQPLGVEERVEADDPPA
jgi:anti-anti-sigma regulatory factor